MLVIHSQQTRPWVSQTASQGGSRQTSSCPLPLVLKPNWSALILVIKNLFSFHVYSSHVTRVFILRTQVCAICCDHTEGSQDVTNNHWEQILIFFFFSNSTSWACLKCYYSFRAIFSIILPFISSIATEL